MKKSINDNRKIGRGRPATGTAPLVGVRMTEELQDEIKIWAKKQEDQPPLATAIRRLVELGLTHAKFFRTRSEKRSTRAKQLSAETIDTLVDPSTSADEAAQRKRKLLKGPEEFRQSRIDHEHSE
jgi:hypothetical protein